MTEQERLMEKVFDYIRDERWKQVRKWGKQEHDAFTWLAILTEEVGEASQAALHDVFGGSHAGTFRTEMIHVTAVAVQILEWLFSKDKS